MLDGYAGKVLRVDLTHGKLASKTFDDGVLRKYIGGSALAARVLFDETSPQTDPLGPDNLLIFMTGPLTATKVPLSGRHEVVAKSPLTGLYGESDIGGSWGTELKKAGYDGVIIEGRSDKPVYLWIYDGEAEIRDAGHLWGKDTYVLDEIIKGETGSKAAVTCIGPAGEKLAKISAIMSDGKHGRAAGRCGLGAVMGSKNLKAISVLGSLSPDVADPEGLEKSVKELAPMIVEGTKNTHDNGTSGGMTAMEYLGDVPVKNWLVGKWEEGAEKLSGQTMTATILTGRYYCSGCIVGCGREVRIKNGKYGEVDGAGPEYETSAMLGANCLIDDLEAVAKANELCNRYGLDTISTGAAIAFVMEAYDRGLITDEDTGGVQLEWGNAESMIRMVEMIGKREGLGWLLGEGVRAASEKIGGLTHEFAIHVKGLELPAHDPRAYYSQGVSYATSNRGACHLQSLSHIFERSVTLPDLGYPEVQDRHGVEGKGELVAKVQNLMCMFDSLKVCKFIMFGGVKPKHLVNWINQVTGWEMSLKEFMKTGERIYNLKRLYNVREGLSRKDDTLPPRVLTQKKGEGGSPDNLPPLGELLSQYYQYRGWDEMGIPAKEKLMELGLEEEADLLEGLKKRTRESNLV
ncbi:MAG: aldehyde ferredoxin oxidoreductase family protein [Candidatus Bathyarchaeota archaeon]|nr:aldehyde ferredoxin oxidoreductase family protein [Candidatus Bathyarchaeota archaeon]